MHILKTIGFAIIKNIKGKKYKFVWTIVRISVEEVYRCFVQDYLDHKIFFTFIILFCNRLKS